MQDQRHNSQSSLIQNELLSPALAESQRMIPPEETTETDLLEGTTSMVLPPEENTEIDLPEGS